MEAVDNLASYDGAGTASDNNQLRNWLVRLVVVFAESIRNNTVLDYVASELPIGGEQPRRPRGSVDDNPDGAVAGVTLLEVDEVVVVDIDGESPGDLYGMITVTDGFGVQIVSEREWFFFTNACQISNVHPTLLFHIPFFFLSFFHLVILYGVLCFSFHSLSFLSTRLASFRQPPEVPSCYAGALLCGCARRPPRCRPGSAHEVARGRRDAPPPRRRRVGSAHLLRPHDVAGAPTKAWDPCRSSAFSAPLLPSRRPVERALGTPRHPSISTALLQPDAVVRAPLVGKVVTISRTQLSSRGEPVFFGSPSFKVLQRADFLGLLCRSYFVHARLAGL